MKRILPLFLLTAVLLAGCGQKPIHDTTEKANTHQQDLTEAKDAPAGDTKTLSGFRGTPPSEGLKTLGWFTLQIGVSFQVQTS